jgi:hypothetical protein
MENKSESGLRLNIPDPQLSLHSTDTECAVRQWKIISLYFVSTLKYGTL